LWPREAQALRPSHEEERRLRGRGSSASVDCPRGNLGTTAGGQSNVESRIAAAKSRDRPKKASNLRTQSPIDGRHLGLWTSCDLHGHAVKAILAALMTTPACESATGKRRGGDRGARGTVGRLVAWVKTWGSLGKKTPPHETKPHDPPKRIGRRETLGSPVSTRRKSRDSISGIHEARVLVVENVLGGRSRFGRISRRAITARRKANRGARPSLKEATTR
jgi:hypothetical protein